ncbi:MAG: UvrD-helicase domain-containing protein [Planctomycetaceae bacterium]|nr:UvrD-helicase domain-containing protein [Planctomycetaceae bacterium]
MSEKFASDLTPSQHAAVEHYEGPLLVLAGPGSGKTRVISRRIARLVERGVDPRQILAITFTNKAAAEMAGRVEALMPGSTAWVSTFHRFCARLLRQRAGAAGLQQNYTIFDDGDQQSLMRQVLSDLNLDASSYPPGRLLHKIGRLKNEMVTAEDFARGFDERVGDHVEAVLAKAYPAYQQALLNANAVDFDDLLLHVVRLLHENEDLRADLDERYRFVLVDEYQDTNLAQYAIVRALSQNFPNLCVTGDPDQSIYGWRGARIENILRFERDYAGAKVVRLEENFRSTKAILRVADELIAHNVQRKPKRLKTDNDEGPSVRRATFRDGRHEADMIAAEISQQVRELGRRYDDFAIFYRVNSLSRELEMALARHKVPYQIAAGVSFYDRAEIKDLLAYLRVLYNPLDVVAFRRIVNKPKRAIGETTQRRVLNFAASRSLTLLEAAGRAGDIPQVSKAAFGALKKFAALMQGFTETLAAPVATLLTRIVLDTNFTAEWQGSPREDDQQRLSNVNELLTAAAQYDREVGDEGSLEGFLEQTSLASEVDSIADDAGRATMMTLHAAKGLEFPCVYVVAVEHGVLPHERAAKTGDLRELEEERRLLFVGVTRAREELTITHAAKRELRGRPLPAIPSEFLHEMTLEHADFDRSPGIEFDTSFDVEDFSQEAEESRVESRESRVESRESRATQKASGGSPESSDHGNDRDIPFSHPLSPQLSTLNSFKLTTGAQLLRGDGGAADLPQSFGVGQQVRHPRYGLGTVIAADGFSRNRRVTVEFEDDRSRKTFVAAKSPLQPVGTG